MTANVKMILPFGDPILRKIAKPVESITPKIIKLLDEMTATLYASEGRAGLAAPQVGILRRVIVMDCGEGLIELINPEIMHLSGEQVGARGLSILSRLCWNREESAGCESENLDSVWG